jgi:hypothetical protein
VVLFSDMVSIAEAVDIFRSATPIIASFEPVSGPSLACVRIDGAAASTEVVDRLVADGRRSFAYISGRASSWVDKKRRGWFSDALAPHGLAFEAGAQGDYSYDSGYKEAVMLLRRRRVDAVICGNDVMAIGVRSKLVHGRRSMTCANSVLPTYMGDPRGTAPENLAYALLYVQVDTTGKVANLRVKSICSAFSSNARPDGSE